MLEEWIETGDKRLPWSTTPPHVARIVVEKVGQVEQPDPPLHPITRPERQPTLHPRTATSGGSPWETMKSSVARASRLHESFAMTA